MKRNELKRLVNTLKNNWRIALVLIIMLSISGYILANYGMKKHFVTSAVVSVTSTDETPSSEKANMAALLFRSPRMYDAINENLETKFSYTELGEIISIEQENGTQVITAKFDYQRSSVSYKLAELFVSLMQKVLDDYEENASVVIIEHPQEPLRPEFPDDRLFTLIGGSEGLLISLLGIFIIWRLDNTITSADNITEQYDIPVIGELIDMDNEIDYLGR